ncbi:MAG: nicotinate phosphoribosyltransferase, partial [Planctomycetes bacterium]|nr:nicotinate phosphoribosyltransferase [Planctomycetota bacterium]
MTYSLLSTDGYKFSMAAAGFPLRNETFYYSHRHGGAQYLPLDVKSHIQRLLPEVLADHYSYLTANDYEMGAAFKAAWGRVDELKVRTLPEGSWFFEREPVFSITGPSTIVSWLEPLALMMNYRIQVATLALTNPKNLAAEVGTVTCIEQREIVLETLESVGVKAPEITVDSELYFSTVLKQVKELVKIVGDSGRIFEVGMRAATCLGQHRIALQACAEAGVKRTSNVELARELDMIPVGTMGHEHVQRWGDDLAAFEAMRDMRSSPPSYLLDTFDTMGSGIVAAVAVMRSRAHACSIRYDSGNKFVQYLHACELLSAAGLEPSHVLEDSLDLMATVHFEQLREFTQWPPEKQLYGYGGSIVAKPASNPL